MNIKDRARRLAVLSGKPPAVKINAVNDIGIYNRHEPAEMIRPGYPELVHQNPVVIGAVAPHEEFPGNIIGRRHTGKGLNCPHNIAPGTGNATQLLTVYCTAAGMRFVFFRGNNNFVFVE